MAVLRTLMGYTEPAGPVKNSVLPTLMCYDGTESLLLGRVSGICLLADRVNTG